MQQLPDAPAAVRDAELGCGEVELGHSEALPASAVGCLVDATASGEPAALAWTSPTVEGDPIVSFALVEAGSTEMTVHESTHFDRFGEPTWTQRTCAASDFTDVGCPYR
ncbi:hypothetical protein [Microbacterium dauci]|uniref:Uncharacterized protein n=1 Tax=Microbacterium dauci TaxID=3048008 RepID=A0ABT6ZDP1_9MICO|nr:hypothetical protein [Microbacterium sp. LX3-4]MDJ1114279.1 hypothetical protein [Microbacterium sp. LX3-4]